MIDHYEDDPIDPWLHTAYALRDQLRCAASALSTALHERDSAREALDRTDVHEVTPDALAERDRAFLRELRALSIDDLRRLAGRAPAWRARAAEREIDRRYPLLADLEDD